MPPEVFAQLIAVLAARTGVDFRCYRRATVERRIRNRMILLDERDPAAYLARLQADPDEAAALLARISIKVSRFFRDLDTWQTLHDEVLPTLAGAGRPLRIWCAGCGHGEEAYSLALLLDVGRIAGEVLATDIDAKALAAAEQGCYAAETLAGLPAGLVATDALQAGSTTRLAERIRARVRFRRHDLLAGAPEAAPFDLICCRNVLIYVERPVQTTAMRQLLAALRPGGYLCLGEAEWPAPELLPALHALPRRTRLFQLSREKPHAYAL